MGFWGVVLMALLSHHDHEVHEVLGERELLEISAGPETT